MLLLFLSLGGKIVIANLQSTPYDHEAEFCVNARVDDLMTLVMEHLNLKIPEYVPVHRTKVFTPDFSDCGPCAACNAAEPVAPTGPHKPSTSVASPLSTSSTSPTLNADLPLPYQSTLAPATSSDPSQRGESVQGAMGAERPKRRKLKPRWLQESVFLAD